MQIGVYEMRIQCSRTFCAMLISAWRFEERTWDNNAAREDRDYPRSSMRHWYAGFLFEFSSWTYAAQPLAPTGSTLVFMHKEEKNGAERWNWLRGASNYIISRRRTSSTGVPIGPFEILVRRLTINPHGIIAEMIVVEEDHHFGGTLATKKW